MTVPQTFANSSTALQIRDNLRGIYIKTKELLKATVVIYSEIFCKTKRFCKVRNLCLEHREYSEAFRGAWAKLPLFCELLPDITHMN